MPESTPAPTVSVHPIDLPEIGRVDLSVETRGSGSAYLLLHGGAGPRSFAAFAELLASEPARVLRPTHPGFDGTPRPERLRRVVDLAEVYDRLLERLGLEGVTVIGNSIGGWIAAELAARNSPRIRAVVIADGTGLEVAGHPMPPFATMTLEEITARSYFEPERYRIDLTKLPPEARAGAAANRAALAAYSGPTMTDPTLTARLAGVRCPTLVVWGEADRMFDPAYGSAYAEAIPGARFVRMPRTGHLPQLETPAAFLTTVKEWKATLPEVGRGH